MSAFLLILAVGWVVAPAPVLAESPRSTIVVELFTSEGCSSCPRADVLLGELVNQKWSGGDVYGLAFHVDYWDRLGWKDRFSSSDFTRRQYRYSERLPDSRVYTPQMVVEGRVGFVGSNRSKARSAIESAVVVADEVSVSITVDALTEQSVKLAYSVTPAREGTELNVALTQRAVTTDVKRGENGGRVLHHSHVVRSFKRFPVGQGVGETKLSIPADVEADDLDAVVYVQDRENLAILGAAKITMKGD